MNNFHTPLLYTKRNNIVDCCYFGSIYLSSSGKITKYLGASPDTLYYMRSLAKPLQTSTLFDFNIVDDINILPDELAIMTGSHSGSPKHIKLLKRILSKYKIKISDINLKPTEPLDLKGFSGIKTKLHNNCSAKHIMMLILSKYLNYPLENYTNPNHPVQKLIYNKQVELSEYIPKTVSFDGCGTPLWEISADGIIKAYYNLINDKKYSYLINSILKYPDYFGGFDRLDSDIIKLSKGRLFSKVGAGGFIIVYNLKTNESLLVKMAQNNNYYRKLVVFDILQKLGWLNIDREEYEYNQFNKPVAKYYYEFDL